MADRGERFFSGMASVQLGEVLLYGNDQSLTHGVLIGQRLTLGMKGG